MKGLIRKESRVKPSLLLMEGRQQLVPINFSIFIHLDLKKKKITFDHNGKLIIYRNVIGDNLHPLEDIEHAEYSFDKRKNREEEREKNLSRESHHSQSEVK